MFMRHFLLALLLIPGLHTHAQSGVVAKGGLLWNDFQRDDYSILKRSQAGYIAGVEVRLGAEDDSYFKPSIYYGKLHIVAQNHSEGTQFFNVTDGYEFLKMGLGIEWRLITLGLFHWRAAGTITFNYIMNVKGSVKFEDIHGSFFGLLCSTGIDISVVSIDIGLEPGFSDLIKDSSDTKPVMLMITAGVHF